MEHPTFYHKEITYLQNKIYQRHAKSGRDNLDSPGSMTERVPPQAFLGHLPINSIFVYIGLNWICVTCNQKKKKRNTKISIFTIWKKTSGIQRFPYLP